MSRWPSLESLAHHEALWQERIEAVVTACGYRQHGGAGAFQAIRLALDLP